MIMRQAAPTILIAEDDPDDRMLLAEALADSELPFQAIFANDGQEVITYLSQVSPEGNLACPALLLLDINMPRKNGEEVIEELAANPGLQHIPVVVLSTATNLSNRLRQYPNVRRCYAKPSSFNGLVCLLQGLPRHFSVYSQTPGGNGEN